MMRGLFSAQFDKMRKYAKIDGNRFDETLSHLRGEIIEEFNQVGLLVMIPGKYIGLDLFINNEIFGKYKDRLYKSHLIELLDNNQRNLRYPENKINSFMLQLMYGKEVINTRNWGKSIVFMKKTARLPLTH